MALLGAQKISVEESIIEKGCVGTDETITSLSTLISDVKDVDAILKFDMVGEMRVYFEQATDLLEKQLEYSQKYLQKTNDEVRWSVATTKDVVENALEKIGGGFDE